jgi:hypothetical protein
MKIALALLHRCGRQHVDLCSTLNEKITGGGRSDRSALLSNEPANSAFSTLGSDSNYVLLTSDGSQIIPDPHDALPVALTNTSGCDKIAAARAAVEVFTRFHRCQWSDRHDQVSEIWSHDVENYVSGGAE